MQATKPPPVPVKLQPLSPREKEVAAMIGKGMSDKEIAAVIVRSIKTVEKHRESIYAKVRVLIPNINRVRVALWVRDNPGAVQP